MLGFEWDSLMSALVADALSLTVLNHKHSSPHVGFSLALDSNVTMASHDHQKSSPLSGWRKRPADDIKCYAKVAASHNAFITHSTQCVTAAKTRISVNQQNILKLPTNKEQLPEHKCRCCCYALNEVKLLPKLTVTVAFVEATISCGGTLSRLPLPGLFINNMLEHIIKNMIITMGLMRIIMWVSPGSMHPCWHSSPSVHSSISLKLCVHIYPPCPSMLLYRDNQTLLFGSFL